MLTIRDFIYLDTERLKSMLSQVDEGLLESTAKARTSEKGASTEGKGSLFGLLEAKGELSYLLQNQETETRALHDNIYNIVEDTLKRDDALILIPGDTEDRDTCISSRKQLELVATETSFVLATGLVNINDYNYLLRFLRGYEKLEKAIGAAATPSQAAGSSRSQQQGKSGAANQKNPSTSNSIKTVVLPIIEHFYQRDTSSPSRITFKIMPNESQPDFRLVGDLQPEFLRENIDSIIYKYGSAPATPWHMFAQIAAIPSQHQSGVNMQGTGSEVEMALHKGFDALRGFERSGISVSYPEVAVTPIAIYRI